MSTIKKQHYIWRGYLKRWTDNNDVRGKLYVYRKNPQGYQSVVDYESILNVGFEKFFYDMTGFDEKGISILRSLLSSIFQNSVFGWHLDRTQLHKANTERDFIERVLCEYERIDNEDHYINKIIENDLSFFDLTPNQRIIDILQKEKCAALYGIRTMTDNQLVSLVNEVISNGEDSKYRFLRYFFLQQQRNPSIHYSRSKMLDELIANYPAFEKTNKELVVNITMVLVAERIAQQIYMNYEFWVERYLNNTELSFLTCDCPIVNLAKNGCSESIEYYYPISPSVAVKLCIANKDLGKGKNISYELNDEKLVLAYNELIKENSFKEIYSKDIISLSRLMPSSS